jgi:PKD repeat protein
MVRRIISIGVTALMLLSALVVLNVIPVDNVSAQTGEPVDDGTGLDAVSGDNIWTTPGDWTLNLDGIIPHSDKTIIVNGNLIINEASTLTLTRVTLLMNCTTNGEFRIEVNVGSGFDGGRLNIVDSTITSYNESGNNNYGWLVYGSNGPNEAKDGRISLTGSTVKYCGYDNTDLQFKDLGLWINSRNNVIDGNYFINCSNAVNYIWTATDGPGGPNTFQNNNVSNCKNGTYVRGAPGVQQNIQILNNEFYRVHRGVDFNISANAVVRDNHMNECYGISAYFGRVDDIDFSYNTIENGQSLGGYIWVGVFFGDLCNDIVVDHNTMRNMPYNGFMAFQYTGTIEYTYNTIENFTYRTGFIAVYGDNAFFYRNYVNKTFLYGFDTVAYWIGPIRGNCSLIENEGYWQEQWTYSNWGAGLSMWAVEEVEIRDNIFSHNMGSGMYLIDCGNITVDITGNTIEDNGLGIGFSEPSSPPSYGGVKNAVVDSNDINDNGIGIWTDGGLNQKFTNNIMDSNLNAGIANYIDGTYIANNTITTTGQGDDAYEAGIALLGTAALGDPTINPIVDDVVLYNNEVSDGVGFSTYPVAGILLEDVDNIFIEENNIDRNEVGVQSFGDATNVFLENCTVNDGSFSDNSFVLDGDSHITALNTPHNKSSIDVVDADSNLTVKWYLHVNVKKGGVGQNGARVDTEDIFGGDSQTFFTMNDEGAQPGWAKWIPLTEFVNEGGTQVNYTNHFIHATYSTAEAMASPYMDMTQSIQMDLNEKPITVDFKVGASVVFRTGTIYIFMNGTDVEDGESEFPVPGIEFEYRDPNELSWNTTYLGPFLYYDLTPTIPDDHEGWWYTAFTPPLDAITGDYDFRGRVKDTDGSYGLWITLDDSVDVRNNLPDVLGMDNSTTSGDAGPGAIYRNGESRIIGWGDDVEDGPDENLNNADFEYKRPGEAWDEHDQYWTSGPGIDMGDWYRPIKFAKSIDTPVGIYEFRVRFQDLDNDWGPWGELEQLDVLNNEPWFVGFFKQAGVVYRGDVVRVYSDVADVEELEPDLRVHFYYKHVQDTVWEDTWMTGNGLYDGFSFHADFNPPDTAELGLYEFKMEITDHESPGNDGATVEAIPAGTAIEVENVLPTTDDITSSKDDIRAGVETVYIHVNATDFEDDEELLKIDSIEWRMNTTNPPTDDWQKDLEKISINENEDYITQHGGYIRASMKPSSSAAKVEYDIRVRVIDLDSGQSTWLDLYNAFTVVNPAPTLDDIILQYEEVFRGDTVYLTLNASDLGQTEDELIVEVEYRKVGGTTWNDISVTANENYNDNDDYWEIPFSPGLEWLDSQLGEYEFRGKVKNNAGAYSDGGTPREVTATCEVKNNLPSSISLLADESSVERGSSVLIFVNGDDRDGSEDDLSVYLEYSTDGGTTWETEYLSDEDYNNGDLQFEITFSPDSDAVLEDYDFRVRFHDGDGYSEWLTKDNLVKVSNAVPVVTSLKIADDTMFRMDSVKITAEVSDSDQDESELTPNFQYKGPTGGWVSQDSSGSYFGDANYIGGGEWEIDFEPPAGADIGDYSFRVEFTDGAGETSLQNANSELTDALDLQNADPEIESIDSPSSGTQDSAKITFEATATDSEDSSLNYLWDFDDGTTSEDPNPEHEYKEAGDYTITLTVTDDDGGTDEKTVSIVISGDTVGAGDFPLVLLLMLLIPLIAVILVLVLLLSRKKKKPEAAPPPAYAAAPGAPPAAAPPVAAPPAAAPPPGPPAPPPAAPMAAPAAAAAPVAAPAAGAQNIKCPKCGTPFTVTDTTRPLTIECPNCHAKGTLK